MKLTKNLLIKLINETADHGVSSCGEVHPEYTHEDWKKDQALRRKKDKSMAKISIKPKKKMPKKLQETDKLNSIAEDKVQDLFDNWKPQTDEGKLYKKQLGKLLGK